VAVAFTDIHCEITDAPRSFVHVFFDEQGSESKYPTRFYIDGLNRAGRTEEVKQMVLGRLSRSFSEIVGVPADTVSGRISETPASWAMEGGAVLPEPGEEGAEWYAHATAN
jgi:phenylpyruvate tautomerase PptA (4-oxalocrotonate tautomerase family)